jgi:heterotetrameric sarcosine oxidase delta subunit
MLLIPCPYCGPRDEIEFRFGGPAHLARPGPPETVSDEAWGAYLFFRDNPKGLHRERWRHVHGCGRWFNLVRSTLTHEIVHVYEMGAEGPGAGEASPALGGAS